MKKVTISHAMKFFVILMFSLGLISAGIQQRNCNTGRCSHVYKVDVKQTVKNVRPLFERLFEI
ncbi:MAG TPA: hypothetical protein VLA58_03445 [Chitinophagaceae bacterium]|nr:hypothetical protein [Chitinophagaceae bacterium]